MRAEVLIVTMLAVTATSWAAPEPTLEATVPSAAVTVGDRVPVDVVSRGGADGMWGELTVAVDSGPKASWAVVEGPVPVAGARPPAWRVVLAPFKTGDVSLPAISCTWRDPQNETHEITVDPRPTVTVGSVLKPDGDTEPAPLRAPLGVHGVPWEWIVPVGLVMLPFLGGVAWWVSRRRGDEVASRRVVVAPRDELERLLADLRRSIGREPAAGLCDQLAAGVRRYLERRSGEPAQEMTSFEIRLMARRLGWPESLQRDLQRVMAVADGVRFGRRGVSDLEQGAALDAASAVADSLEVALRPSSDDELREVAS